MNRTAFEKLQRDWYSRARAAGFHDIEAPSGMIARRRIRTDRAQELDAARAFLYTHEFRDDFDRRLWELHADGFSNRSIARKMGTYRKRVDRAAARLTALMLERARPRRKRGRPREMDSMRADGVTLTVRLSRGAAQALDHLRQVLRVPVGALVRMTLLEAARAIPARAENKAPTEPTGQGQPA